MDIRRMEQQLEKIFRERKLPGAAVCARGPDGEMYVRGFGHRDGAGLLPVDGDTVFGIASMSKSITALALCLLECEGKISLDDPVVKYVPEFSVPGVPACTVTLRHLCMHRGALPPMEPLEWSIARNSHDRDGEWIRRMRADAPNDMADIHQVMEYIAHCPYPTLGMPGDVMSYSNEGYAVLCYAFDAAAGEPLEAFVKRRIFEPLGMKRSVMEDRCEQARALAQGNISSLFEMEEDGSIVCDDAWSVMPPFRGCATVKSTAKDMAAYYRCLANFGVHAGLQVWPRAAVERMVGAEFPPTERPCYCLGLNKRRFGDAVICEHSGGLHGISTHGSLLLGRGWGFAALSNLGDTDTCEMCWAMMNAVLGIDPAASHEWAHPAAYPFDAPQMLEGEYVFREGDPVRIAVSAGPDGIAVQKDGRGYRAEYAGGTLFRILDGEKLVTRAEFLLRDGRAWALRWGSRVTTRS